MVNAKNENTHSLLLCPWLRLQHAPTISSRFSQIYSKLAKASHEKGSYTMSNILYQESYKPPNFALSCQPMFRLVQFEPALLVLFRFVVCPLIFSKASIHLSLSLCVCVLNRNYEIKITDDELIAAILELFPYHTKEPNDG